MPNSIPTLDIYPNYSQILKRWSWKERLVFQTLPAIPRNVFLPFVFELFLAWVRLKSRNVPRQYRNAKDLLVNLGAGQRGKEGWVNVDVMPASGINCVYDCRNHLPFPNESVKAIFCEHFFEHIDYTEEVPDFLSECYRVLQPGGVIRIVVPDGAKYLRAYCSGGWDELSQTRPLDLNHTDTQLHCQYNTPMELINVVFRNGFQHKFIYDHETLEFLLRRYGFSQVERQEFGQTVLSELNLDAPHRRSESLYIEAIKTQVENQSV